MKNPFDFFESIYIINRHNRTDYMLSIKGQCKRFGINYELKGHDGNHIKAVYEILQKAEGHVLILEDDCVFIYETVICMRVALSQIALEDWDMLYLGAELRTRIYHRYQNWQRLKFGMATHAICYHEKFRADVSKILYSFINRNVSLESIYCHYLQPSHKVYLINPMVALRQNDKSGKDLTMIYNQIQGINV